MRCPHPSWTSDLITLIGMCGVPPYFEPLTRCPKLECAVSPNLILNHLISSVGGLAQLVSPSVALPAELVHYENHSLDRESSSIGRGVLQKNLY